MTVVGTVVAARMNSVRLPGKAMLDLDGVPMIQFLLDRLRSTKLGGPVVFATTERADDDVLASHVAGMGVPVFRGADDDVAQRYVAAGHEFGFDWIVRVTGDCPFVDGESLDFCLSQWNADAIGTVHSTKGAFPVGIDYEVVATETLRVEWPKMSAQEREHVTLRLYRPELGFVVRQFTPPASWPVAHARYVVDTPSDYGNAARWTARLGSRRFSVQRLLELADD